MPTRRKKPNSVRAMRALRKENRELRDRLVWAKKVEDSRWLATFPKWDALTPYLRSASRLGFVVEISLADDEQLKFTAVRRVGA